MLTLTIAGIIHVSTWANEQSQTFWSSICWETPLPEKFYLYAEYSNSCITNIYSSKHLYFFVLWKKLHHSSYGVVVFDMSLWLNRFHIVIRAFFYHMNHSFCYPFPVTLFCNKFWALVCSCDQVVTVESSWSKSHGFKSWCCQLWAHTHK